MPEKQKTHYPILSQRNIGELVHELTKLGGIELDFVNANQGSLALNIGLDHKDKGPLDNDGIDGLLGIVGFQFKRCFELDKIYGRTQKYYIFQWRKGLWVAIGDNGYAEDWTRILIKWADKLDRDTREAVLDSAEGSSSDFVDYD